MEYWTDLLARGCHNTAQLKEALHLTEKEVSLLKPVQERYPMFVNPYYLSLVDPCNKEDPIRKMSIPTVRELEAVGSSDTSGEKANTVLPGLQHKYSQTALVLSTDQCAMYCRHCFRRRMVGRTTGEPAADICRIASYIREHKEISNVLISGGDAFMNSNEVIETYLSLLCSIPHLDFIRFGTRTPVVLPQRITTDNRLQEILKKYGEKKRLYIITQFNHPREITAASKAAVDDLLSIGISVRNQAVLLKGVNDSAEILSELFRGLTAIGVIPYYLFQCRPVIGVANHFQVPLRRGCKMIEDTMNLLNGPGKSFRYIMSHVSGKIEILGLVSEDRILFKYHQSNIPDNMGRLFEKRVSASQCWL